MHSAGELVWAHAAPSRSCCQLVNLLASFPGWLSLQVGEAELSHGAFPNIGETARNTHSPLKHCLGVGVLRRISGGRFGGGTAVLVATARRREHIYSS